MTVSEAIFPEDYKQEDIKILQLSNSPVGEKNCSVGEESLPLSPCLTGGGWGPTTTAAGSQRGRSVGQSRICREDVDYHIDLVTPTFGDRVILSGRK